MPSTTHAPPSRATIYETVVRLGKQRGAPRYYVNTRYLERAGFQHEMWLDLVPGEKTLTVRRAAHPTGKRVQKKNGLPLIDLNCKLLQQTFGDAQTIYVRVETSQIVLSVHPLEDRLQRRPRDGSVGGLYAGAGLMDEALCQAGLRSRWAVEIDPRAADVYGQNHPEALLYAMSVYEAIDLDLEPVEVLAVGQPCPPWSNLRTTTDNAGTKRDRSLPATAHPLGDLAAATIVLIAKLNPRTVILENVPGFATSETAYLLKGFLEKLQYHVDMDVLDAWDYGALTQRKRFVLVAQTPEPDGTVRSPWPMKREPSLKVGDILDAEVDESLWWDRSTKPNRFRRVEEAAQKGRGFKFQEVRAEDRRLGTLTAEYGNAKVDVPLLCHPERPETYRYFTLAEGRRIMGVPEGYQLPEGQTYPWELLGQSVYLPLFTEIVRRIRPGGEVTREAPPPVQALSPEVADLPLFGGLN